MTLRKKRLPRPAAALAAVCMILAWTSPLFGCSTVVVGKKASLTGRVLLGHNEDNEGRLIMVRHLVPAAKHTGGSPLVFEDGRASIPQSGATGGLAWSETIASWNSPFSESYVNEWGVAAVSDSCWPSREDRPDLTQGGIGYGLLRVATERARTAREAVAVAAKLLDEYGYYDSGRTYIFADKDEGWFLEVVMGRHYAAQRVPDDEVAFIPNHYTIRGVDPKDARNFVLSPGLVEYALGRGWYKPAREGSFADFDFKEAFGVPELTDRRGNPNPGLKKDYNVLRHKCALEMLTGRHWGYADPYPFSVKPARPVGPEEIKALLRSHHEGTEDYLTTSLPSSPHSISTICASETQESLVVDFRSDPRFTVVSRATGRPCTSPFVPWYLGIQRLPDGSGSVDPDAALRNHFHASAEDLSYDPDKAWWSSIDLQNILEPQYLQGSSVADLGREIRAFENENLSGQEAAEAKARSLLTKDPAAAMDILTRFTNERARAARDLVRKEYQKLAMVKIKFSTPEARRDSPGGVLLVTVLSSPEFDAGQVDPATVVFGPGYIQTDKWIKGSGLLQDTNDDGRIDLVMAFPAAKLVKLLVPCKCDVWLTGKTRQGRTFVARDFLTIKE